jgi:hypothetical protein
MECRGGRGSDATPDFIPLNRESIDLLGRPVVERADLTPRGAPVHYSHVQKALHHWTGNPDGGFSEPADT